MKTKLLRRVTKRFSIVYYPNGFKYYRSGEERFIDTCVILWDNHWTNLTTYSKLYTYYGVGDAQTKAQAYERCLDRLQRLVLDTYSHHGVRRLKHENKAEILWKKVDNKRAFELQQAKKSWDA